MNFSFCCVPSDVVVPVPYCPALKTIPRPPLGVRPPRPKLSATRRLGLTHHRDGGSAECILVNRVYDAGKYEIKNVMCGADSMAIL
ncbi:hypothetical protein PLICRDRAFT_443265 [Plicaturopsis crispa FD-325 SS-3]|uniref:Uncharacterized protein n=1 Tax=Plicaturopsis crispa FD-325 SS-3 TaxID=944288 RepID=A0A0C9SWP9_PLICR|nr:hypothetical protein PLICRDRAFT_443265 [Plicaturopsis crispa FD-325 SS-3]